MTTAHPTPLQLDALREVATIGCGHAADALSRMISGGHVRIEVPRVMAATAEELLPVVTDEAVIGAMLGIEGAAPGRMLFVSPEEDAQELAALLTGRPVVGALDEAQQSAVAELANIVGSSCLTAIGTLTKLQLLPSTPDLVHGNARDLVLRLVSDERAGRAAVVVEARFHAGNGQVLKGRLFVVPAREGLSGLFKALGL